MAHADVATDGIVACFCYVVVVVDGVHGVFLDTVLVRSPLLPRPLPPPLGVRSGSVVCSLRLQAPATCCPSSSASGWCSSPQMTSSSDIFRTIVSAASSSACLHVRRTRCLRIVASPRLAKHAPAFSAFFCLLLAPLALPRILVRVDEVDEGTSRCKRVVHASHVYRSERRALQNAEASLCGRAWPASFGDGVLRMSGTVCTSSPRVY